MKFEAVFNNIVFAVGCVFLVYMIISQTSFDVGKITAMKDMYAIEAAHTVDYCFKELGGNKNLMKKDFLDSSEGKKINDLCSIEKPNIEAMIKDLENGHTWGFPDVASDYGHKIYVSIIYDRQEIHPGVLYVKI